MRKTLLMAVASAALFATPALAQDIPATGATVQPPSTDPVGTTAATAEAEAEVEASTTLPSETATPAEAQATAEATVASNSIVAVMRADGQFSTLLRALDSAGLTATLESDDSISILAPTDAAFAALPAGELDRLMQPANAEELRELLLYHVLNANVHANQIENRRGPVVTGSGAQILLDGSGRSLRADAATITNAQLRGSNGAVLVVDQVLSPSASLADQGDESGEAEAGVQAGAEAEAATETAEPTAAEMPSTPPVDEGEPAEEGDPVTPQT